MAVAAPRSVLRAVAQTFLQNRLATVGLAIIVFFVLFSYLGPVIYPTNQVSTNLLNANLSPRGAFPLGTDGAGYNILGRLMVGGQSSLEMGFSVAIVATLIGTFYGAISGFVGGLVDAVMMRIVDALLAIPALVLLLILVNIFKPTLGLLIIIISLLSWLGAARLVRGETLTLRVREYVQAVKLMGGSRRRIVTRHIVPNAIGVVVVNATFTVADAILIVATLDFLGLGIPPPAASWGGILNNGLNYLYDGYWWLVYPAGVALVLTVVAFNLIGDALRDALDVRLQEH
ncbi:MAG: ABC transporter permease [Acidimicrobiales bacterium]